MNIEYRSAGQLTDLITSTHSIFQLNKNCKTVHRKLNKMNYISKTNFSEPPSNCFRIIIDVCFFWKILNIGRGQSSYRLIMS